MKYKEMMKNYYGEVYNISELLKTGCKTHLSA